MSHMPLRTFNPLENAIYVYLTNTHIIIGTFVLVLMIIFTLAAFLDKHWRTAEPAPCEFGSDHKPNSLRQSSKKSPSKLYTRYADLSARGLGTAERRITLRVKKQPNQEVD